MDLNLKQDWILRSILASSSAPCSRSYSRSGPASMMVAATWQSSFHRRNAYAELDCVTLPRSGPCARYHGIETFAARMGPQYGGLDFSAWRRFTETLALCRAV